MKKILAMLFALGFCALVLRAQTDDPTQFPKEFRKWATVKTVLVGPQSPAFASEAGIHHIYANKKALEGYETGRFPDGSVIVYELLDTKEAGGDTIEAARRRIDVMAKESEMYRTTGGWGFRTFPGGNPDSAKLTSERQAFCFGCHGKRKDHDSVFSEFRK